MNSPVSAAKAIERVGIVGCGVMGIGLAETCARAGLDVRVAVSSADGLARGRQRLDQSLARAVRKRKLPEPERDAMVGRISFTADLGELADRQFVIEAVPENEALKLGVFAKLDAVVTDQDVIIASNTSAISITKLAQVTKRPAQVLGAHFFNPVPVLPLVELISSLVTDGWARAVTEAFVTEVLSKQVIHARDRSGFVVNALLIPYLIAAIRMVESGHASAEDIDRGMTIACEHPIGPLALVDLIGLDTVAAIGEALHAEFKEPTYTVPPLLSRMVESGRLGRKTGRGFYFYD